MIRFSSLENPLKTGSRSKQIFLKRRKTNGQQELGHLVVHAIIPALRKLRQENHEFETRLDYVEPILKKKKKVQVYEKMLTITSHRGNANQNHNVSSHYTPGRMGIINTADSRCS
jgi:hypothetical protein